MQTAEAPGNNCFKEGRLLRLPKKVHFWILLFFTIRLVGIMNPPLDANHNWRQVWGLMIARDFFEGNTESAFLSVEFPFLNFLHFSISLLFGYTHWYGRLINLVVSSVGLFCFYKIVVEVFKNKETAFLSTMLLSSSIWFSFSRKMMPDTFSISLVFIGLWYGFRYISRPGIFNLMLFCGFVSMGLLTKIPSVLYLIAFLVLLYTMKIRRRKLNFLLAGLVFSVLVCWGWYFSRTGFLLEDTTSWHSYGKPMMVGFKEVILKYKETLHNFTFNAFQGFAGFVLFVAGIFLALIRREKDMVLFLIMMSGGFLFFVIKAGWFFYHHNYYVIPFVPVMAIMAGYALSQIKHSWVSSLILILCISECLLNQYKDFMVPESEKYKLTLENIMDQISSRNDLIIINGNGNPQMLYLAHRNGWSCVNWEITELRHIRKIISKACKFIVIDRHANDELDQLVLPLIPAFENKDFRIYHAIFEKSGLPISP